MIRKVLIVVDMQKDFIDGALGTKEAVAVVERVVKKIEGFQGDILATLDTHLFNYPETAEGKKLPVVHCIKMTSGWMLNEKVWKALAPKKYKLIEKNTFGSVDLVEEIRKIKGDEELEIELVGVCTDICVVSNALLLKTFFPESRITVHADCCAGVTPDSHQAALTTMKMCQIDIA